MEAEKQQISDIGILDEFQIEFAACWHRLPNKFLFFTTLIAWVALFQFLGNSTFGYIDTGSLFQWMLGAYNSPNGDDGHGPLVPLVVLGLFWWKRKELLALPLETSWPSMVLVVFGLLLHVGGYILQEQHVSIVGFFVGLYGLTGLAWGLRWLRASFFPFFLFIFCVPLGGEGQVITMPLRLMATRLVEFICHNILAIDVIRAGTQLADPQGHYQYEVAAACGGIRSLAAILALATVFGFITLRTSWKRAVMIISAFPLAVIGNVVRLLLIIVSANFGGQSAGDYVHEGGPFGVLKFVPYIPAILALIYLERYLREPIPEESATSKGAEER